ncbi:hypothetical protein MRY87_09855 [bacterium]|nr:hypothetical protein [bacterium]
MNYSHKYSREDGFTLFEAIITLLLTSIVCIGAMQTYTSITGISFDHHVRIETHVQAQAIMQTLGNEVRILGNGVPFDQQNFSIGEVTLSDPTVTEPIDISATTATSISFRLNETGEVALLTADFDPSSSLTLGVTDVSGLDVNDPIYISNSVISGDEGLYGVISGVNAGSNTITLNAGYVTSAGATFGMGSILEEVPMITYAYTPGTGITRDSGFGAVLLGSDATMNIEYLDINGNSLALPLTNTVVMDQLRSVRITISLTNDSLLKDGTSYTSTVSQVFGLRNLNYFF